MPQCQPEEAERPHDRSQPPDHGRLSFWSVTPGEQALYFGLFTLLATLGLGFAFWYEIAVNTSDTPFETVEAIIRGAAAVGVAAAGLTLVAMALGRRFTGGRPPPHTEGEQGWYNAADHRAKRNPPNPRVGGGTPYPPRGHLARAVYPGVGGGTTTGRCMRSPFGDLSPSANDSISALLASPSSHSGGIDPAP